MKYSTGQDMMFVILALISALALLSEHAAVAFVFLVLSILFVIYEHRIFNYIRSA
jgi:hypothetical protein